MKLFIKTLPMLLILFAITTGGYTQNLVLNSSFEDTVSCPDNSSQINRAVGCEEFCETPDYFHSCAPLSSNVSTPTNAFGFQTPSTGKAYAGFAAYKSTGYREYAALSLISPLNVGTKYYISFNVVLNLNNFYTLNCATNKIGATFTTTPFTTSPSNCFNLKDNNPHFYTDSIITDTLNWTKITGSFVADSSYNFVVIGNFFDNANSDTISFHQNSEYTSYYFLDDVCIGTDSVFVYNCSYATSIEPVRNERKIECFPNPVRDFISIKNSSKNNFDIEIFDSLGKLIYSSFNHSGKLTSIDLSNLNQGLLFIKIKSNQKIEYFKIFKL